MDTTYKFIEWPSVLLARFGGIAMGLMMLHLTADVLAKYFLNKPLDGTLEMVSAYYMVAVSFLPLAFVSHNEGHIRVELFTRALPDRVNHRIDAIVGGVTVAYVTLLAYGGYAEAVRRTRMNDVVETSTDFFIVWPSRWMVPLGYGLMAVYMIWRIVAELEAAAGRRGPVGKSDPTHSAD